MSSGSTCSRPWSSAIARAPRSSASEPRTERSGADAGKLARRADEVDHPALQQRVDVDVLDGVLERPQVVDPDHRLEPVERMTVPLRLDDLELLARLRVAERRLEEEAVELGLGEGEDALVVERVLRREDQERARQRARTVRRP